MPAFNAQWPLIANHPFNQQLHNGSLSKSVYHAYMQQDLLYLNDYVAVFQNIIYLMKHNQEHADIIVRLKENIVTYESGLRRDYLSLQKTHSLFYSSNVSKIHSILQYTKHLFNSTQSNNTIANGLAAILPCYYIYFRLGKMMAPCNTSHPFYDWISGYYSESFIADTQQLITLFDHYSETANETEGENISTTFFTSVSHEIAFVDELIEPLKTSKMGELNSGLREKCTVV